MSHVFILGAGKIGQAIASILRSNRAAEIELWDKDPKIIPHQKPLETLAAQADIVILCVNSWVMDDAIRSISGFIKKTAVVLTVSKGIEDDTGATMDELMPKLLPPGQPHGIVSGPMLATELSLDQGGGAVLAVSSDAAQWSVKSMFTVPGFFVEISRDVRGVALCGVLKNVYAIGLGIAEGLKWGSNMKGWYVRQALTEMQIIVTQLNGRAETVLTLAGIGDFIATGFSHYSKNHQLGRELAETGSFTGPSEGYTSFGGLMKKINSQTSSLPILEALRQIIVEKKSVADAFSCFFKKL